MTPAAIREGFGALRTDSAMRPLADAAVCRSESDWLVGINGTRAMTAFNSKSGGFHLTTVGRVQTPTLAILVEREEKIRAFVSRNYWEVQGHVPPRAAAATTAAGSTKQWKKKEDDPDARAERLWDEARAQALVAKCAGQPGDRHRGIKADHAGRAAALRSHEPAARGERPLRPLGAHDALARAVALRKAQGAHVSAHRLARAAGGLHRHREGDDGIARRIERVRRLRARRSSSRNG